MKIEKKKKGKSAESVQLTAEENNTPAGRRSPANTNTMPSVLVKHYQSQSQHVRDASILPVTAQIVVPPHSVITTSRPGYYQTIPTSAARRLPSGITPVAAAGALEDHLVDATKFTSGNNHYVISYNPSAGVGAKKELQNVPSSSGSFGASRSSKRRKTEKSSSSGRKRNSNSIASNSN
eukprot:Filipodium_phascolosomae@DN2963_c0_g1_i1.p1